jgi:hypothetical protein
MEKKGQLCTWSLYLRQTTLTGFEAGWTPQLFLVRGEEEIVCLDRE